MADDDNVISLDARRRAVRPEDEPQAPAEGARDPAGDERPVPGQLVWLHCPTCHTLEYTELVMPGGRTHNACGTQVQELPLELDLRAEHTVAEINLERLTLLQAVLDGQRERFTEYQRRLQLAAGKPLRSYDVTEERVNALPIVEVDGLGLLVSRFFHEPTRHFAEDAPTEATPDEPPAGDDH